MKKICHVTSAHSAYDDRILHRELACLAAKGYDAIVIGVCSQDTIYKGVKIKAVPKAKNRIFRATWHSLIALVKARRTKSELYHLHDVELLTFGMILKIFTRAVVVFDVHEDYIAFVQHKHYLNSFFKKVFSVSMRLTLYLSSIVLDGFVFADEGTAEGIKKMPSERKMCFHNFPVRSMFPDKPQKWTARKYDMVFMGSLTPNAGLFVILEAISIVSKKIPSLKCLFIGKLLEQVKLDMDEYVQKHCLGEFIEAIGWLPHSDIPNLLQECKIGLVGLLDMPKFHKNIASKMFEYMMSGVPVVSSDLPPERKYITSGKHGYLVRPGDSAAMAEAIFKILSNAELGQSMSEACHRYMLEEKFFAENEVEKLIEFYTYLAAHRKRFLCVS